MKRAMTSALLCAALMVSACSESSDNDPSNPPDPDVAITPDTTPDIVNDPDTAVDPDILDDPDTITVDVEADVELPPPDEDEDGIIDEFDNCPTDANADQADQDGDGTGNVCDEDLDGDGDPNTIDNCPSFYNPMQMDLDEDGTGDACDDDADGDDVTDTDDNCPFVANTNQFDGDGDEIGDVCDSDGDGDGIDDGIDNCPLQANDDQADGDEDGVGDVCDDDHDGDGVIDSGDNCPELFNPKQLDGDFDEIGDACDPEVKLWLLSVQNTTKELMRIDLDTGVATPLCVLDTEDNYPSTTFSRDGVLYAANNFQDRLDIIDPCTCEITEVGTFGFEENVQVVGITTDYGFDLFGVENQQDVLLHIDTDTGLSTEVGDFGVNFGASGATWSDTIQGLYAIDGSSHKLWTINPATGAVTYVALLPSLFVGVGIELHPGNDKLYACTNNILYEIDKLNGDMTEVGVLGENACNNLAAPYAKIDCPNWPE